MSAPLLTLTLVMQTGNADPRCNCLSCQLFDGVPFAVLTTSRGMDFDIRVQAPMHLDRGQCVALSEWLLQAAAQLRAAEIVEQHEEQAPAWPWPITEPPQ
jgi:hypothetical protein